MFSDELKSSKTFWYKGGNDEYYKQVSSIEEAKKLLAQDIDGKAFMECYDVDDMPIGRITIKRD